ncbi:unnamed protein product [Closterium sp. NIES-53]
MGTRTRLWPPLPLSRALVSTHFTLAPESSSSSTSPVSSQVLVSGPVAASCSWRSLAHPTVLWHHRFGHPPIPRLCAMSSQRLVLGLPRVLPSLPPLLAPPCVPCVEGRLRTTPLSSSLRPATEPFETLHLDVRGPAARPDPKRESFFFVVVDDYSRYTTVFPLVKNSQVTSTLIRWFITTMDTRGRRVSYLHSERGGEFRSDVLAGFCRKQGICQFWTVPESPRENGVAERRIGLIMEIARTSMTLGVVRLVLWRAVLGLPPPRTLLLPPTPTGPGTMPVFAVHQAQQQQPPPPPPTSPLAVGGESALGCDALEDRQFELEFLAAASPHLYAMLLALEGDPGALHIPTPYTYAEAVSRPWASQWRAATDSEMASYRFTGTYVNKFPPPGVNVVDGMWIFRVKRPPGSPPVFKARMWLEHRKSMSYTIDFSTAFLSGSLHEEVWLRRPTAFTGTFPPRTQWRLRRPVYGLRQAPREWHDTLRSTLSDLGFQSSSTDPSLFVHRGSTPFFVLVYVLQRFELQHSTLQCTLLAVDHRLTRPFPDESFEPCGPYAELVGCHMYLMTCTRPDLAFPLSILARFVAPGRHRLVHWTAAVRVAKYLATTSGVGLVLGGRKTGDCDSSYADDAETYWTTQG